MDSSKELLAASVTLAADDCRAVVGGNTSATARLRAASAAAFFFSPFGREVVRDLAGHPGVRAGVALAQAACAALGLTAEAVMAVPAERWEFAIERSQMPAALAGHAARRAA